MKTYLIRPGKPAELPDMPAAAVDTALFGEAYGISASAQLCYDDEALYVRLSAVEEAIRAENRSFPDEPCEDSCLEFFFRPLEEDPRYLNIEFNPNKLMFLGLGTGIPDLIRLVPLETEIFTPEVSYTEDGWEIRYAIPHAFVRRIFPAYRPGPGKVLYGNFYKCGDLTPHPHYLSWSPITEGHTFHRPGDFGKLIFE